MRHRLSAALLAALLLFAAPCARAEQEPSARLTVHIGSAEELRQLAASCAYDTWSDNVDVILDRDIDLSGESFTPIPIFNGSFDGQGHTISGMEPASDGSNQGLFRFLREQAEVRDLCVVGALAPTVGREYVGGLAGANAGRLFNCEFEGSVTGLNYVGGLVGSNSGSIVQCRVRGEVSGKRFTGGIAGHNEGLVSDCVSFAEVNTAITEARLDLESLNTVSTAPLALLSAEDENVVSDTGGIAGYSSGVVLRCINRGTVGYQHYGYNVGGVAGRQAGCLSACENYGAVLGRKDVGGIVGQMEPWLLLTDTSNLADELILLNSYMNAAASDLALMSDQMRGALDSVGLDLEDEGLYPGSIYHAEEEVPGGTISGGSGGGTISGGSGGGLLPGGSGSPLDAVDPQRIAEISEALSGMAGRMDGVVGAVSDSAGYLSNDLRLANNQFSRVLLLLSNALSGNANRDVFSDISDELGEGETEGRVSHSLNLGRVEGDSNVGGIAGAMGVEYEFDLEDALVEKVGANGIVNNSYSAECVCSDNVNRGAVLAKKDRVGGVVGCSEMGVVLKGESYASVSSSDGGYVGGVVGYAEVPVRFCYAMCDLSGASYVGGIAGRGAAISDCASLIAAAPAGACLGAIAGWADMTQEGAVVRNVFVHDSLGAVDGISYQDLAMPVSYEELLSLEGLPAEFRTLKLSFVADGELVERLSVAYGASLSPVQIPAVPVKEGFSGAWEDFDTRDLHFSTVIHAVYTPYQSAVATSLTRGDSPQAIVLLEGSFSENVRVAIEPYPAALEGEGALEGWSVRLENTGGRDTPRYNVRYQPPTLDSRLHRLDIQVLDGGEWKSVSTAVNGSYLSFPASGESVTFRAVELPLLEPKLLGLSAACALSLLGLSVILLSVGRRRRRAAREKRESPANNEN